MVHRTQRDKKIAEIAKLSYSELNRKSIEIVQRFMQSNPNTWQSKVVENEEYKLITDRMKKIKK